MKSGKRQPGLAALRSSFGIVRAKRKFGNAASGKNFRQCINGGVKFFHNFRSNLGAAYIRGIRVVERFAGRQRLAQKIDPSKQLTQCFRLYSCIYFVLLLPVSPGKDASVWWVSRLIPRLRRCVPDIAVFRLCHMSRLVARATDCESAYLFDIEFTHLFKIRPFVYVSNRSWFLSKNFEVISLKVCFKIVSLNAYALL